MIYTLEKRHSFAGGQMFTNYEVIEYKGRIGAAGILTNGKTVKKGTLAQCEKYCRTKGITAERI